MLEPTYFRDLVSGRVPGIRAALLRTGLRAAGIPYGVAMWCRNRWYDHRSSAVHQAAAPVISVGNLTLGGTGKTPFVAWLARWFRAQNVRVSLISRGYGATDHGHNDEAQELELLLPDVPHLQDPDRVAATNIAIEELGAQLVVLDDGFQHRRLHRDLDIVLIDATEFGTGQHIFPGGLLRESERELSRADAVILTRSDQCSCQQRDTIRRWARRRAPNASWTEFAHVPAALVDCDGATSPLESLAGRRIVAFCGIGNPTSFRRTIEACGGDVVAWREFPDHHSYSRSDIAALTDWTLAANAHLALCTQKDLVKIGLQSLRTIPLCALQIKMAPRSEVQALESQLQCILERVEVEDWLA